MMVMNMHFSDLNPILFGWSDCSPNWSPGKNKRDCWVLHYVESGFGTFTIYNKTYHINPGDVFVIPPYVDNLYKADAKNPWHYIWIDFDASEEVGSLFTEPVIHCPGARKYFDNIKSARDLQNGRTAYLTSCLWSFISFILEKSEGGLDHIKMATSYIEAQYNKDIKVSAIAEKLNLDRTYFSTLFKRHMGVSPLQYINRLRLQHAAELMQEGKLNLTGIATEVGYSDIYHFSKAFKRHFGCSPREYIKRTEK